MVENEPTLDDILYGTSETEEPSPAHENASEKILKKTEKEAQQGAALYNSIIDTSIGTKPAGVTRAVNNAAAEALFNLRHGVYNVSNAVRAEDFIPPPPRIPRVKGVPNPKPDKGIPSYSEETEQASGKGKHKTYAAPSPLKNTTLPAIQVKPLSLEEEVFVRCFSETEDAGRAYERAFPFSSPKGGVVAAGKELLCAEHIRYHVSLRRLNIITEADISITTLLEELEEARALAMQRKNPAAAIAATMAKAKLTGLDRTTVEFTGKNGGPIEVNHSSLPPEDICRRLAFLMNAGQIATTRTITQEDIKDVPFTEVKE